LEQEFEEAMGGYLPMPPRGSPWSETCKWFVASLYLEAADSDEPDRRRKEMTNFLLTELDGRLWDDFRPYIEQALGRELTDDELALHQSSRKAA
jgi:hypothetical protein